MNHKGLILAGGLGTRLYPVTLGISKQLIPVYNKPMIYYPISTLMLAGIREILIISTPRDQPLFENLLGDGSSWGLDFVYKIQESPRGLAEAFIIGKNFINGSSSALILGDNIFYDSLLVRCLESAKIKNSGATIFGYRVANPSRYGVAEYNNKGQVLSVEEKPENPKSDVAVTGLYFYDQTVCDRALSLAPSKRGELEITDLNMNYLKDEKLEMVRLGEGSLWFDAGTHDSLLECSQVIASLEKRIDSIIACPEAIAYQKGWIDESCLLKHIERYSSSDYGRYLKKILVK